MDTTSKTFDEWKATGYQVKKGEKATGRNDEGKATFRRTQVKRRDDSRRYNGLVDAADGWDFEGSWESMIPDYDMPGPF